MGSLLISNSTPVLVKLSEHRNVLTIEASLEEYPNQLYIFEFFGNHACDLHGFGEGEIYLGRSIVTSDAFGVATASFVYGLKDRKLSASGATVNLGSICLLTMISTRLLSQTSSIQIGDVTSKFSVCRSRCTTKTPKPTTPPPEGLFSYIEFSDCKYPCVKHFKDLKHNANDPDLEHELQNGEIKVTF
jgi:hypothetical protein